MGKEEDGRTKALISAQKQDSKGIGFGTEGAFKPWWDDLYNNTAVSVKVKKSKSEKETTKTEKSKKKSKAKAKAKTKAKAKAKAKTKSKTKAQLKASKKGTDKKSKK